VNGLAPKAYAAPRLVLIGRAAELVQGGFYGDDSDYNYGLGWYCTFRNFPYFHHKGS
jgi:hypothetical protein